MIIKICGVVIICLISTILLKSQKSSIASFASIICIVIVALSVMNGLSERVIQLIEMADGTGFSEYILVMVKALGIAYIAIITSEICTCSGEAILSNIVEGAAKIEILFLCTPMITKVFELTKGLI